MSNEEITALAREYAEEIYPNLSDKIISLRTQEIKNAERLIRFLLRRYALVEKEAIRKEYESVKDTPDDCNYEEHGATWDKIPYLSRFYDEGYDCGQKNLLESLFPEIAKEVER